MNRAGTFVRNLSGDAGYDSFRPSPLPPNPVFKMDDRMVSALVPASRKLAELDTLAGQVPDVPLFLSMYIRKEALISSQIEGTQCTLDDILAPDAEQSANLDVAEVLCYVKALHFAMEHRKNLPLCCRFVRDVHRVLLCNTRGKDREPGEFRRSQNWIGPAGCSLRDARYVPPNVDDMLKAMSDFERYINTEDACDPLVRTALVHYQFETIHPFLDGNGRMGRLLILLCLMEWGLLHSPILYVSYFLKKNQWEYYGKLETVRLTGDYEQWVLFFLEAVHNAASDAADTIRDIHALMQKDAASIRAGRNAESLQTLFRYLASHPIVTISSVREALNFSTSTARRGMNELVDMGILRETTHQARNRVFAYEAYLSILRKGT